jgi:plastocyanin
MTSSLSRPGRRLAPAFAILIGAVVLGCGGSAGGSAAAVSLPPGAIAVKASEYKFDPATIGAMPGSVTIVVTNTGATEHELRLLKGDAEVGAVAGIAPGATGRVTVSLEPGSYTYVCKIAAHDQLGMKGTLTVGAS